MENRLNTTTYRKWGKEQSGQRKKFPAYYSEEPPVRIVKIRDIVFRWMWKIPEKKPFLHRCSHLFPALELGRFEPFLYVFFWVPFWTYDILEVTVGGFVKIDHSLVIHHLPKSMLLLGVRSVRFFLCFFWTLFKSITPAAKMAPHFGFFYRILIFVIFCGLIFIYIFVSAALWTKNKITFQKLQRSFIGKRPKWFLSPWS